MRIPRHSRLSGTGYGARGSGRILHARGRQVICPNRAGPIIHHHHGRLVKPVGGGAGPFGNHATLGDVLSWYKMDEESGSRLDSTAAGNDLNDVNTVLFDTGVIGNAADFVAGQAEELNGTFADFAKNGVDWCFTMFAYHTNQNYGHIAGQYSNSAGWGLFSRSNNTVDLYVRSGAGGNRVILNVACTANAWHHIYIDYDFSTNTAKLRVDDANEATGSPVGGNYTRVALFNIGNNAVIPALTGKVDLFGTWDGRVLTAQEVTDLNNGGAGLDY